MQLYLELHLAEESQRAAVSQGQGFLLRQESEIGFWAWRRSRLLCYCCTEDVYGILQLISTQPADRQQHLETCFTRLMQDVQRSLEPRNRDKFTQVIVSLHMLQWHRAAKCHCSLKITAKMFWTQERGVVVTRSDCTVPDLELSQVCAEDSELRAQCLAQG